MRRSRKFLSGMFFGLMAAASTPPAYHPPDYPFRECIEQTFAHIRDVPIKIGRCAKRTGTEIAKQSKKLAESFRDGVKEIWAAATKDEEK